MQRVTVALALAALVGGTMIASSGVFSMVLVGLLFVALGLGVWGAMTFVDRGTK